LEVPQVTRDDLGDAGDGYGEEGAEQAGEFHAEQDGYQYGQRVEFDGAGHDDRLEQVVLHLLIDDEEDGDHNAGGDGVQEAGAGGHDRAEGRADQRDEGGDGDEQRDQPGERHSHDQQEDIGEQAADQ